MKNALEFTTRCFAYDHLLLLGRHLQPNNDKDVQNYARESSLILMSKTECKYNNIIKQILCTTNSKALYHKILELVTIKRFQMK